MIQTPFDHPIDILFLERLGQVVIGSLLDGFDRTLQRTEGCQHHHGRIRTHPFEFPQDREPIHRTHANIGQHQVDPSLAPTRDHLFSAGKDFNVIPFLLKGFRQQFTCNRIVVGYQNRRWLHHASSPA